MLAALNTVAGLVAAGDSGEKGADLFWNTSMGTIIAAIMGAIGVVTVLVSVVKGFAFVGQGKPGQAVKIAFGAIALCIFLFRPVTMNNVISKMADLFDSGVKTVECIKTGAESANTPGVPATCASTPAPAPAVSTTVKQP